MYTHEKANGQVSPFYVMYGDVPRIKDQKQIIPSKLSADLTSWYFEMEATLSITKSKEK